MKKWEVDFLFTAHSFIIVQKITVPVVEKAIRAFVDEQDDGYWLKLHHTAFELDINDLNAVVEGQKNSR